jgi:DNA-directed RNA polymerase II subunit RPB9
MASPESTTSDTKRPLEQITFRFCSECSNMLYPKEDPENRQLLYTCRTCQYTEEAASSCVFRNVLNSASGETAGVTQDVASDPTVSIKGGSLFLLCCRDGER